MTHADRGRRTQRVSLSRAPREPVALERMAVVLDPGDDVAIATPAPGPTVLIMASRPGRARAHVRRWKDRAPRRHGCSGAWAAKVLAKASS